MLGVRARRLACLNNVHLTCRTARLIYLRSYLRSYLTLSVRTVHPHLFSFLPPRTGTAILTRSAHSVKIRPSHQRIRQHVFMTRSVSAAHRACIDPSLPSSLHRTLRIAAVDAWLYICDTTASAFALLGLTAVRHRIQREFDDAMGVGEHRV